MAGTLSALPSRCRLSCARRLLRERHLPLHFAPLEALLALRGVPYVGACGSTLARALSACRADGTLPCAMRLEGDARS